MVDANSVKVRNGVEELAAVHRVVGDLLSPCHTILCHAVL
jgi:hypothetical protein